MELGNSYTELILERNRDKSNRCELEHPTHCKLRHNPSCGDEIILQLKIQDSTIEDIAYTGTGCTISQASTSIMCDVIKGKSVNEVIDLYNKFISMIKGEITDRRKLKVLKDAVCFQSISTLPARVECAVFSWYTLKDMLEGDKSEGSSIPD